MAAEPILQDNVAVYILYFHRFLKDNAGWKSNAGLVWRAYIHDLLACCHADIPGSDAFITLSVTGDCSYFSCMYTEGRGPGGRSRALPIGVGSVEDMFHLSRLVDHVYTTCS